MTEERLWSITIDTYDYEAIEKLRDLAKELRIEGLDITDVTVESWPAWSPPAPLPGTANH